jgi:type IV pilus assembly protein PilN
MIRINLLQERKAPAAGAKAAKGPSVPGAFQAYALLALFGGGALVLCAGLWWIKTAQIAELDRLIKADQERQRQLEAIKKQVDEFQAKKTLLEAKVNLIEKLKAEQKAPVHMLDEISKALPDFVWLTDMNQTGANLLFKGEATGLTAVADFISALQRSGWFPQADLVGSQVQGADSNVVTFDVSATFKDPAQAAREKEAAAAAAAQQAAADAARAKKK